MYIRTDTIGTKINSLQKNIESKIRESTERLSTGLRINGAKDDAAGLQISTRMTSKSNELKKALGNIKDGVSYLQTADGNLSVVLDHLHRARELSIQAQNGTNSSTDIEAIKNEYNSIVSSINQIAESSTFNGKSILSSGNGIGIEVGEAVRVPSNSGLYPQSFTTSIWVKVDESTKDVYASPFMARNETNISPGLHNLYGYNFYKTPDQKWQFWVGPGDNVPMWNVLSTNDFKFNEWTQLTGSYDGTNMKFYVNGELIGKKATAYVPTTSPQSIIGNSNGLNWPSTAVDNLRMYDRALTDEEVKQLQDGAPPEEGKIGEWLFEEENGSIAEDTSENTNNGTLINGAERIGSFSETRIRTGGETNSVMNLRIATISSETLSLENTEIDDPEVINILDEAIQRVVSERSKIGAYENRLKFKEQTSNINQINVENSKSRISDANMEDESSRLIKEQIRMQSSIALLKQNNNNREQVLSLLGN